MTTEMSRNLSAISPEIADLIKSSSYQGTDRVVHFTDYLAEKADAHFGLRKLKSFFPAFDEKISDLMATEVTVISGKTGEGKTLFAESWIRGLISKNQDARVCIFSYEVSPHVMLSKYENNPDAPIYLPLDLKTMDPDWLHNRCHEAKTKFGCEIFLFDHLHFLVDMNTKQNVSLNIGAFMRKLKFEIAVDLKVCPILIAHQGQPDKRPENNEPTLESIRDSSFIAQEADNVLLVWRKSDFKDVEIASIRESNPVLAEAISMRQNTMWDPANPFANQFAMVQIAKARRSGTYRWKKLFQKVGEFLEEV